MPVGLVALVVVGLAVAVRYGYLPLPLADEKRDAAALDPPPADSRQDLSYIERLSNPLVLTGWDERGLILDSGRRLSLPEMKRLPRQSDALAEVVRGGVVETDSRGRVFGLVRVWHWCGNDPVRRHVARVDLSLLLRYEGEGHAGRFGEHGWDVSYFMVFQMWARDPEGFMKPSTEQTCTGEADAGG